LCKTSYLAKSLAVISIVRQANSFPVLRFIALQALSESRAIRHHQQFDAPEERPVRHAGSVYMQDLPAISNDRNPLGFRVGKRGWNARAMVRST
jgi:hypothetical protein